MLTPHTQHSINNDHIRKIYLDEDAFAYCNSHTQHSINNDHIRKMKNLNNLMKLPLLIAIHDKEKSPKDKSRSDDYMFATDTC